jgi:hypothetical protein
VLTISVLSCLFNWLSDAIPVKGFVPEIALCVVSRQIYGFQATTWWSQ